jgi:hypothetical protein
MDFDLDEPGNWDKEKAGRVGAISLGKCFLPDLHPMGSIYSLVDSLGCPTIIHDGRGRPKKYRHLGIQLNHDAESDRMSENWSVVTGRDACDG